MKENNNPVTREAELKDTFAEPINELLKHLHEQLGVAKHNLTQTLKSDDEGTVIPQDSLRLADWLMYILGVCPTCETVRKHHTTEPFASCACGTGEDTGSRSMVEDVLHLRQLAMQTMDAAERNATEPTNRVDYYVEYYTQSGKWYRAAGRPSRTGPILSAEDARKEVKTVEDIFRSPGLLNELHNRKWPRPHLPPAVRAISAVECLVEEET